MKECKEGGRRNNERARTGSMREPTGRRVGRMKELREDVGGRRMRDEGKGEGEKGGEWW